MKAIKENNFEVGIRLNDGEKWGSAKLEQIKAIARRKTDERTPDNKLKNQILSLKYQMEEYLEKDVSTKEKTTIHFFVKEFLETMNVPFSKFARFLGQKDVNLKKYTTGERKFNADLAVKFSYFFHTSPELWLNIQSKNEILEFKEHEKAEELQKFDYKSFLEEYYDTSKNKNKAQSKTALLA